MEALPTQQVASFFINGGSLTLDLPITGPSLLRHTTTLQNINLEFHGGIEKSSTTIFENCINLEVLKLFSVSAGYYIDVTEIQATSWQCLKLRQLDIGVSCCEPPVNPEIQPYYFRSVPITLTRAETEHFTQLERLYLQLGRLTELRRLVVVMVNPYHEITTGTAYMPNTLPALMTLGDESNGRPGYLHYLAGLTKLEFIGGSMDADTEEAKATVGWAEVAWIYEHWPRLHTALIFKLPPNIENPFVWLQNKYEKDGKQLILL
ncbi:hypothetical protein FBU30_004050 [Linnemannia zychae]|nr:hypothetical protein FBU30_004050 [Linnemannia zychae]